LLYLRDKKLFLKRIFEKVYKFFATHFFLKGFFIIFSIDCIKSCFHVSFNGNFYYICGKSSECCNCIMYSFVWSETKWSVLLFEYGL
jgi:hypothetical protein